MNNYLHTGLYKLDVYAYDFEVAHIYEHLLIRSFENILTKAGFSPYLYGWVGGETFDEVLFIEFGLYNPDVKKLFEVFITSTNRIDFRLLDTELLRIQAEDESIITNINKQEVIDQLHQLDQLHFEDTRHKWMTAKSFTDATINSNDRPVSFQRSKKSFRKISIISGLVNAPLKDQMVFLRLAPVILDAINHHMFSLGAYQTQHSWPRKKTATNSILICNIFTIRKGKVTTKEIVTGLQKALNSISMRNHEKELEFYRACFISTPNWHSFPIDYYRYTGILATKEQIVQLSTPRTVEKIINTLQFEVTSTTNDHSRMCIS